MTLNVGISLIPQSTPMAMATPTDTHAMDLSARTVDLLRAVTDAGSPVARLAQEVVEWIAREGLNKEQFTFAMESAKDFTAPNNHGCQILQALQFKATKINGMNLVLPAGAIGRSILNDASLCWLASTEAVLLKYAGSMEEVERTLCELVLSNTLGSNDPRRSIFAVRVRPVIAKCVQSIALHSSNLGASTSDLPENLCKLGTHLLQPGDLARLLAGIQASVYSDTIVHCAYCATEVLDWVYNHWPGRLQVSYANSILFDGVLGHSSSLLIFLIENQCSGENSFACIDQRHTGKVYLTAIRHGQESFRASERRYVCALDEHYNDREMRLPQKSRIELYDIFLERRMYQKLSRKEVIAAQAAAQEVIQNLMEAPVVPDQKSDTVHHWLRFLSLKETKSNSDNTVPLRWWLARSPAFLQANFGRRHRERHLFHRMREPGEPVDLMDVLPELCELSDLVQDRCECDCTGQEDSDGLSRAGDKTVAFRKNPPHCLQNQIQRIFMLHIAHSLVDAAGVDNISNLDCDYSRENLIDCTTSILVHAIIYGEFIWKEWLALAACAVTGLPYDLQDPSPTKVSSRRGRSGNDSVFAWCAGSLTVVPKWYKVDQHISLKNSWGVLVVFGVFDSLSSETAVIESRAINEAVPSELPPVSLLDQERLAALPQRDDENVDIVGTMLAHTGHIHHYMMLLSCAGSMRVFNPGEIYKARVCAMNQPKCEHKEWKPVKARLLSLEAILKTWSPCEDDGSSEFGSAEYDATPKSSKRKIATPIRPHDDTDSNQRGARNDSNRSNVGVNEDDDQETPFVFVTDGSALQLNIALGLSRGRAVVGGSCCLACLIKAASETMGVAILPRPDERGVKQLRF